MGKSSDFLSKKNTNGEKAFRLNAKQVFLTYAQCDCPRDVIVDYLRVTRFGHFVKYAVCQEEHKRSKTGVHLHVLLVYEEKINVTSPTAFDITSGSGRVYHPNVGAVRNAKRAFKYIHKEDNEVFTNMVSEDALDSSEVFWKEPDPDRALAGMIASEPEKAIRNYFQLTSICEAKRRRLNNPEYVSPYPFSSYRVPEKVTEWAKQIGAGLRRCKFLIIIGHPEKGKTDMMRSIGPHVFMRSHWSLDALLDHHGKGYIVFDDADISAQDARKLRSVLLAMGDCILTDKYKHKISVNTQGKPVVLITNYPDILDAFKSPAWIDQFTVCYVEDLLYTAEPPLAE